MHIGMFEAIGLVGIGIFVVTLLVLLFPSRIVDAESLVLLSIFVGIPLVLIGIVGAWLTGFLRRAPSH